MSKVAHIPSFHPYILAIDPGAQRRQDDWSLDEIEAGGCDVLHLHFGFEHLETDALSSFITEAHERNIEVVYTVHDIDNPHLVDQSDHHARNELLVEQADGLVTLTRAAADEIERRWNRRPTVVPHPPLAATRRSVPQRSGALVWLGTMRPNLDVGAITCCLAETTKACRVVVRRDGWERADADLRAAVTAATDAGHHSLEVIGRPDDAALVALVASAEVLVLPYLWGTHSGIAQIAVDVGTRVLTTPSLTREEQGATVSPREYLAENLARLLVSPNRVIAPTPRQRQRTLESVRSASAAVWTQVRKKSDALLVS